MLRLLASTYAASFVRGLLGSNMPGHGPRCAYIDCKKTTDKRTFGQIHKLSDEQRSSYSAWLKRSTMAWSAAVSALCCAHRHAAAAMLGCAVLHLSSHSAKRSVLCMDCM